MSLLGCRKPHIRRLCAGLWLCGENPVRLGLHQFVAETPSKAYEKWAMYVNRQTVAVDCLPLVLA